MPFATGSTASGEGLEESSERGAESPGWKNRRRFLESCRGWGFAVMETEPGAKELIAGCTSVFIWKLKGQSAVNARAFVFGWGFL